MSINIGGQFGRTVLGPTKKTQWDKTDHGDETGLEWAELEPWPINPFLLGYFENEKGNLEYERVIAGTSVHSNHLNMISYEFHTKTWENDEIAGEIGLYYRTVPSKDFYNIRQWRGIQYHSAYTVDSVMKYRPHRKSHCHYIYTPYTQYPTGITLNELERNPKGAQLLFEGRNEVN